MKVNDCKTRGRGRNTRLVVPLTDPTSLSLLYHLNSEPWLNGEAYARRSV